MYYTSTSARYSEEYPSHLWPFPTAFVFTGWLWSMNHFRTVRTVLEPHDEALPDEILVSDPL